jgi:hypothetical protein
MLPTVPIDVQVVVFCYALSPSDGSEWRLRIEILRHLPT